MELHKESNQREQSRYRDWNPDRGSRNQVPGGWEFAGDERADGNNCIGHVVYTGGDQAYPVSFLEFNTVYPLNSYVRLSHVA